MTKQLVFSAPALRDIDEIYNYTRERWGSEQADRYILALREYCESLGDHTRRGRMIKSRKQGYAALAFQSHFIIYIESADALTIARILHRRMNIAAHL
jgi:toxin ParE1/3/4